MSKPVVLCILDGWGINPDTSANAPALAKTPNFDRILATCPNATLITHGPDVGLPSGQMGNSEVGHTNIGAGRVVAMDLGQIDLAIEDGSFATMQGLVDFIAQMQASGGRAHLMGLVSDGGVHSQMAHMIEAARVLDAAGIPVIIHAITDGRDVAPKSAEGYLHRLTQELPNSARIGTVVGRYYAMDRDSRWDRVAGAVDTMRWAEGVDAKNAQHAVEDQYLAGITDEFIPPTVVADYDGMHDGDGLFCLNFRADRAREILAMLADPEFDLAPRNSMVEWAAVLGMAEYSDAHNGYMTTVFPKRSIVNTLGSWVAQHGLRQFRLAETEKYPHVTFFLNGGKELPETDEDRHMAPSPKVATYDLQPEMSAAEVGDHLVAAINDKYDLIVVNFANPDMVGHTGDLQAAIKACEAVDENLGRALDALTANGGAMLVTADHGNCETMIDPETGGPHTAHTTNLVPVICVGGPDGITLRDGRLADLAPTILRLMKLPQPTEMTGSPLF